MPEKEFEGKTVVVTGGASGLGEGIVRRFGHHGARVVLADLDPAAGLRVIEALRAGGADVSFQQLDVREPTQSESLVEELTRDGQGIDIWVNAVGSAHWGPADTLPPESWTDVMDLSLSGTFYCCQAAGRQMLSQGHGVIVNVASVNGYQPIEGGVARSVADAGLIMLTEALGIEWSSRGVRVVAVAAGPTAELLAEGSFGEDAMSAALRRTPMRRVGSSDEIAEAVAFLASDEASFIVAETLRVDGGWVAYQLF